MTLLHPLLATVFLQPMQLNGQRLWFLLPLCLSIAVVYKTTKVRELKDVPLAALLLFVTILAAMAGVCLGLYVLIAIFIR